MTESAENTTESVYAAPIGGEHRDRRLHRVLAWVGIVSGVVFTVAVIFFSGLAVGRASGYNGWHRGYQGQMGGQGQMGRDGGCPMMRSGSMMEPGGMGPGGMMDPDDMMPGMMRPGPASSVPSTTVNSPAPR